MEEKKKRSAKGQGHFGILDDGRVEYRKSVGIKANGKRKVIVVRAATQSACLRLMKEKEAQWEQEKNSHTAAKSDTVTELCQKHLKRQIENGDLKPKSVDRREGTIKNQVDAYPLGHMIVSAVTPGDIEEHIARIINSGLSASSVKKALDVLNAAYEWATARGDLFDNPVTSVKKSLMKRVSRLENKEAIEADVIVFSEEEEKAFEQEALKKLPNGQYQYAGGLYGRLLLHTGMRVGELISLKRSDYDQKSRTLTVDKNTTVVKNRNKLEGDNNYISVLGTVKNQKARVISLTEEAVEDLAMILAYRPGTNNDLLCRTKTNKPYTATMMEHCMDTIYRRLGFDENVSGLHIFRRTFATRMYENGAGVKDIAAYIGDLESTTMKYYIAVRKKVKVGVFTKQVVPVPGKRNSEEDNKNAPVKDRGASE